MEDTNYSIIPSQTETSPGYSLTVTPTNTPVSPQLADARANIYHYALGGNSPGVSEMTQQIINSQESNMRERLSTFESIRQDQENQQKIFQFVQDKNASGNPLTEEDVRFISSLDKGEAAKLISNPELYLERKYASRVLKDAFKGSVFDDVDQASRDYESFSGLRNSIALVMGAQRIAEDVKARYEGESFGTGVLSTIKTFVPFMSWYQQKGAIEGSSSFLKGNNVAEQVQNLYKIALTDPDKALTLLQNAVGKMYESSPKDAIEFAQHFVSYSGIDQSKDNIWSGVDIATAPGSGLVFKFGRGLLGGILQSVSLGKGNVKGVMNAAGNVTDAAYRSALDRIAKNAEGFSGSANPTTTLRDIYNDAVLIGNIDNISTSTGNFSANFASSLTRQLKSNMVGLMERAGLDRTNVLRMEPGTPFYNQVMRETQELFNIQYPDAANAILSLGVKRSAEDALTNTDKLVFNIGRRGGQGMFSSEFEAKAVADLWGIEKNSVNVVEHAPGKFYLQVSKAVDETSPTARHVLWIQSNDTPRSISNTLWGWLRSRDELLPQDLVREAKNVTFGSQGVTALAADIYNAAARPIRRGLSRAINQDMDRFLSHERDFVNPITNQRGMFSNTLQEFSQNFHQIIGRLPSEAEATFYFTNRQMSDADFFLRNLRVYSMKSRLGYEDHQFFNAKNLKDVPWVEGRVKTLEEMYRFSDEAGILVMEMGETPRYLRKRWLGANQRQELNDLVNQGGYKVVQLSEFGDEALRAHTSVPKDIGTVHYVIVKDSKSRPLSLEQIPYRPGGHVVYDENFFISQPRVYRGAFGGSNYTDYRGDTTLFAARSQQEAQNFAQHLNTVISFVRGNNIPQAQQYLAQHIPQITWQELQGRISSGGINVNEEILWRPRNKTLNQQHGLGRRQDNYPNFTDNRFNAHNGLQEDVNLRFALSRDEALSTVFNQGTTQNPLWNFRPSQYVDPITTQARANKEIFAGRYLDDYKIKASERFMAEFGHMLEGDALEWSKNPLRAVLEGTIKTGVFGKEEIAAAKNYQRTIKEFLHTMDEGSSNEMWLRDLVMRQFANPNRGEQVASRLEDWFGWLPTDGKQLQHTLRSLSFSSHMGLFNPKQLFMQAQGVLNTAAIDGSISRAIQANGTRFLMGPLMGNPTEANIAAMADRAVSMGWNRDHFIESFNALRNSGFQVVERTFSGAESGPIKTTQFFEMGERYVRMVSWNTAYLRWREANPLAAFDNAAKKEVLNRADLYSANMSKASDAGFQHGWSSIPTQFWSYQARMTDLMWGNRLTSQEKLRLLAANTVVYGVPIGTLGILAPSLPGSDVLKKETGMTAPNDAGLLEKTFYNGLPQALINWATGGKYDPAIANTFGPSSLPFLYDVFNELTGKPDKGVFEILGGASGKLVKNIYDHAHVAIPLMYASVVSGDRNVIGIGGDALLNFLQEISGASNAIQAYYMTTAGEYVSKNKSVIKGGFTPVDGFLKGFFGMNPQVIDDYYNNLSIMKSREEAQKYATEQATMYLRKSINIGLSPEQHSEYIKKAFLHMEMARLTPEVRIGIIKEVGRQVGMDKIQRLEQQFLRKDQATQQKWFDKLREVK